ncbi:MAG: N-acyl-D-amino-acid deacylase family protein [Acidimicrobiales bacterium]
MLDCLITGGTVVDGTGAPGRRADLAIRDGLIVEISEPGEVAEPARHHVDATDLVVAPGVVDIHTHYDAQLFWDPTASPSSLHGVTTVIGGNCGFTLAPAGPEHADYLMRMMARVEGMPLAALEQGLSWDWSSFADWLDRLQAREGLAVNAGFLAGHSALRRVVMGEESVGGKASEAQVGEMSRLLHDALAAGAMGFSSSQAHTHNDGSGQPVPSRAASRDELLALAATVRDHEGTTLELIVAGCINGFDEAEVDLMASMSLAANRPLNWNVLGVNSARPDAHVHQLDASTRAAERGAVVVALTLPHIMTIRLSFLSGFILDGLPGWRDTMALRPPERVRALADPDVRARLGAAASSPEAGMLGALARWERMEIVETFSPANAGLEGRMVGDIAAERGRSPFDALLDVVVADGLRTGLMPAMGADGGDADAWRMRADVWRDPRTVVGGSDAGAHLDMMCGAVYSTHLLGDGVRERGLLSIEEAVHQLTDVPARLYGLRGRGRLAAGWRADVLVFDPTTVGPGPVRTRDDLPGGASRLYADSEGIAHVLVNGTEIVAGGKSTGALPGTLMRSGRDTESVTVPGVS